MKILLVSFDKALTQALEEQLKNHEVYTAKNAEEALTLSPKDVDVVVFDAISGAISEEEINQLYEKKYKDKRFVVLYDELFPIDEKNLFPPDKTLVSRDLPPEQIAAVITGKEAAAAPPKTEKTEAPAPSKPLVLLVSFDKKLTDALEERLKDKYETQVLKNLRQVKEKGKEAALIVYDAISGSIAEKNLNELSQIPELREKPYLILLDELFPINVEGIDLPKKASVNRDAPPELIVEEIEKLLSAEAVPQEQPAPQPEEQPQPEVKPEPVPQEAVSPSLPEGLEEKEVKGAIVEAISRELHGLREEVRADVSSYIKDVIEAVVREELEKFLSSAKINDLVRDTTRRVLEQKLKELLE
ncbi:MAG: hypothetical protein GXO03_04265 [Aquificae bacterium]|nr:hypothetical protein [Aquificota bacterium]